jgi:methylenetetrahydrofolate dehydrogenase (NADP+)/methenyltetrahydrofolate cyclohydrolase
MATATDKILDGRSRSREIRDSLKVRVDALRSHGVHPRLDVLVSEEDTASLAYVRMKHRWAEQIGIIGESYSVNSRTTQEWLITKVAQLNADPAVHGVLIQHPLPKHLDEGGALEALGPEKDVDGMTPQSLGLLASGRPGFRCATPLGIMRLLESYGIGVDGLHAVVVGRSVILGKPAALMLLEANATVTICHSRTLGLDKFCRSADLLVAAVGKPELIRGDWIKPGAVVVDAGYNKLPGREKDVGDVAFDEAAAVASWITPVPGGVGPMTVAMLLSNVVDAAEARPRA